MPNNEFFVVIPGEETGDLHLCIHRFQDFLCMFIYVVLNVYFFTIDLCVVIISE